MVCCEDCYRHVCGYRERCSTNFFGTTDCRCSHHRCSGKSNVVCGNDGITYASVCHLQSAECSSSKFIGIHHFGMCRSSSSQPVTTSPPPATTASRNSIPDDDDLFGQLLIHTEPPEAASEAPKRCLYKNQVYNANNELIKINECLYRICNYEGILREILVPGCPGGPVEPDYGVDKYPVDGGWSSWSSWSECEGSCLNSTHYRTRTCTNPSPMYEGRNCNGDAMETQRCIPAICELSCNYSTWSPWSACSVTCGRGTQMRTRSLLTDVFDEAVCRLGDVRVCSRPRCKIYNCRRRSTWKFFVNERGCRSIKMFKDYYCSGACGGSDENCCRATRYYLHRYIPMQCEGDHSYRDHDFPNQISECSCAACEEESGEGINLGEQGS